MNYESQEEYYHYECGEETAIGEQTNTTPTLTQFILTELQDHENQKIVNGRHHNKGFNPETLEFDGVKILERDKVTVNGVDYNVCSRGSLSNDNLSIMYYDEYHLPLTMLNITAHYPAKDKELERLEGEINELFQAIIHASNGSLDDAIEGEYINAKYKGCSVRDLLDRYYQTRKKLDEYLESKNK